MADKLTETVERLRELLAKATDDDLTDGGRYFHDSLRNFTSCYHGDTGEYGNADDGKVVELLWNNRHTILAALTPAGEDEVERDGKLTAVFREASPVEKWEMLVANGLIGTNEPWIGHMRDALAALSRPNVDELTRPIIGIENRTAQEAFDIMSARIRAALGSAS